jgi:hypothetical protein
MLVCEMPASAAQTVTLTLKTSHPLRYPPSPKLVAAHSSEDSPHQSRARHSYHP